MRWPARPAEHRDGLDFSLLLSLFQDKESKENSASRQKVLQTILGKQKKGRQSGNCYKLAYKQAQKTNVSSTFVYNRKLQCQTNDQCTILLNL